MARRLQENSSTDMHTASSSEDEDCSQREQRRPMELVYININGSDFNVAVGNAASVTSTAAARTTDDINTNNLDVAGYLNNPSKLFDAVARCRGTEKDIIEKLILRDFFPYIEKHAITAASSYNDALELLARFSSPELNSPRLAKHSLKIIKRLLHLEFGHCESANAHIIEVERILRRPFVDGSFAEQLQHDQRRRAEVYNSVLALILLYLAKGHLKHPYIEKNDEEEMKKSVSKNIIKSLRRNPRPQKDRWRCSMETMLNLIERLFDYKKQSQMTKLLDLCKDVRQLEAVFKRLQCTESDLVDQFVILKMFRGKLCNNDGDACQIVEHIIKNHHVFIKQGQHRDEDWQFALLACQTLLHIINDDELPKANRILAANCLDRLTETKVYRKSAVIRYIIEKHCIKTSFARDLESRKIVSERFDKGFPNEILRKVFMNQVCKKHESKGLEYIDDTIYENEDRQIAHGLYDHKPAAITVVINGSLNKLYSAEDQDLSTSEKHLRNETGVLRHLNQTPNKHVPTVFAADTKTRPFHVIRERLPEQDLPAFLRVCKEDQDPPTYRQLLEICLGISNCMVFIHSKQVIHKQLLPEHILLDHDFTVKITGFWNAKILSTNEMKGGIRGEKLGFVDPSIRFAAPECLEDNPLFSPESDVWSFGVLLYVVFTCGGTPYANQDTKEIHQHVLSGRSLTKDWIRDEIFSLIQKCMGEKREDRISFQKISEELQILLDGKGANERIRIPETIPNKDDDDPITMDEEHALGGSQLMFSSVLSNPNGGFGTLLDNETKGSSSASCRGYLVDHSKEHLKKLRSLEHPHLARILNDRKTRFGREITYKSCEGPNLRNYILGNNCALSDVIRFAAQITEAVHYLHSNNIVVCVLNAESIRIVNNSQVQLFKLHFSRSFLPSHNELTTSLGVAHGDITSAMYRWCAKEVIQDGLFSPSGDIWSLGMTILEMFMCLSKDDSAKPFSFYSDEEILDVLKMNIRPFQPAPCPDWVYIVVTQCWCLHPIERASSMAVLDCLTQKRPWDSHLLQCWMEKNEIHENWPDLKVVQTLDHANSISRRDVESSVSYEFADHHTYEYERPFWKKKAFKSFLDKFKKTKSTPRPVLALPSSRPSSIGVSASVMPSSGQSAFLAVRGPASSSLSPRNSSIHSRSLALDLPQLRDTYENDNENQGQSEAEERVQYANVGLQTTTVGRISCYTKSKNEVVHVFENVQGPSRRNSLLSTDIERKEDDSDDDTYDRPKPQECWILDVEQKEDKEAEDGNNDDINDRSKTDDNLEQKCRNSDIKQMEVKRKDNDTYDDINDRSKSGDTGENPIHECRTPDESYQELSYSTEDEVYMHLVWNSSELLNEPSPSADMNEASSDASVSVTSEDAQKVMCCQAVFYMNI